MSPGKPLDQLSRAELIEWATELGVERAARLTRPELRDEILRRTKPEEEQAEARGLFGLARAMLASVVEGGLNMPDAAALIRGTASFDAQVNPGIPVATVTLAEIYAAQGHVDRAQRMLRDVLAAEPDHSEALRLQEQMAETSARASELPATEIVPAGSAPPVTLETTGEDITTHDPPPVVAVEPAPQAEVAVGVPEPASQEPVPVAAPLVLADPPAVVTQGEAQVPPPPEERSLPPVRAALSLGFEGHQLMCRYTVPPGLPGVIELILVGFAPSAGLPQRREASERIVGATGAPAELVLDGWTGCFVRAALVQSVSAGGGGGSVILAQAKAEGL